ncbi:heme-binding domain-containing protein [uncultured Sunxiuqinia sp.]|uniref:heme-binding domain-containing protein n=1 Tax=uncultured Sunxiuqinia sp. TaxID=1573825 RepID=UPI002AA73D7D|nr:heme-binding domain-containing protein [uncultured Sunxiuqinia sp.]
MPKILKVILVIIIAALIVIQFIQPEKNEDGIETNHLLKQEQVPTEISAILTNACLDCHSNQTTYLWYHRVAPVSFFISNHIHEGKGELNLSDWGTMDILDKIGTMEDIAEEVEEGEMPLKSYTLIHPKARLSEQERKTLIDWTESMSERLLTGE